MPDTFVEIADADDPLLDSFWLPLYRTAFPPDERVPEYEHQDAIAADDEHLLVGFDGERPVSMARYDVVPGSPAGSFAYLMYMAVEETAVSRGHGQLMFAEIVRRAQTDPIGPSMLVFEVQRPDMSTASEPHQSANRRIDFYRRQESYVLDGVDYVQSVPGQAGVPMLIMAHPLARRIDPGQVLAAANELFGDIDVQTSLSLR